MSMMPVVGNPIMMTHIKFIMDHNLGEIVTMLLRER